MNCRNIVMEEVAPTGQRARIRRREPPLYSYKVLKVRPFSRRRNSQRAGELSDVTESVAIHWRRGHFKHYTADRPLLGRHTGLFWWQPHLAGRAPRVADKDYSLDTHRTGD